MNRRRKVMFLTAALVLQFAVFCGVQGQMDPNGKIQGRVVDAKTKDPLMGVGVSIVGENVGTTTDPNGAFLIPELAIGTYTLRFRFTG